MKQVMRSLFGVFMCLAMLLSMAPVSAYAQDAEPEQHEHSYEAVVTAATCTEAGSRVYTCAACGDSYTEEIPAGHSYEAVVTAATCTEAGSRVYTCAACGDSYTEEIPAGHSYEAVETAATCTQAGSKVYTCAACGDSYTEEIPAAHSISEGVCTVCGYDEAVEAVKVLIAALPSSEEYIAMDDEGQLAAQDQLMAAYEAFEALTEEQKAAVDTAAMYSLRETVMNGGEILAEVPELTAVFTSVEYSSDLSEVTVGWYVEAKNTDGSIPEGRVEIRNSSSATTPDGTAQLVDGKASGTYTVAGSTFTGSATLQYYFPDNTGTTYDEFEWFEYVPYVVINSHLLDSPTTINGSSSRNVTCHVIPGKPVNISVSDSGFKSWRFFGENGFLIPGDIQAYESGGAYHLSFTMPNGCVSITPATTAYMVSFDTQGGSLEAGYSSPAETGMLNRLDSLPAASVENGTFQGWYTEANGGGSKISTGTVFQQDTTVYAYYIYNFAIDCETPNGGSLSTNVQSAAPGEEITISVTPDSNYTLTSLTVMQGSDEVTVTDNKFTMPAGNVTVTATFTQIVSGVAVSPASLVLEEDSVGQLSASVTSTDDSKKTVTWGSGDNSIATVDGSGLVTAVGAGETYITASSTVDSSIKGTATVHVHGNWTYSSSDSDSDGINDTIEATCGVGSCDYSAGSVKLTAPASLVYNGSEKAALRSFSDWKLSEAEKPEVVYSGESDRINCSGKEIIASLSLGTETVSLSYTIEKAASALTAPAAISGLVYDGSEKALTTEGYFNGGVINFSLDGSSWSSLAPKATEAGPYTVYWEAAADRNHNAPDPASGTIEVSIAAIAMSGIEAKNVVAAYDGNAHSISVTGVEAIPGATVSYSEDGITYQAENPAYTDVCLDGADLSSYTVYYKVTAANYEPYTGSAKITINPIPVKVSGITANNKPYDGLDTAVLNLDAAVFEGKLAGDVLELKLADGSFAQTDASENAITVNITNLVLGGADVANYYLAADSQSSTTAYIINASQTAPVLSAQAETILNKADGKIINLSTEMEYSDAENGTYTAVTDADMSFAAGTYYVRYAAKKNFDASPAAAVTVAAGAKLSVTVPSVQIGYSLSVNPAEVGWQGTAALSFSLNEGYSKAADFALSATNCTVTDNNNGSYTLSDIVGNVTVSVAGVTDSTAPTGTVSIDENNSWNSFISAIGFDRFFKEKKTVTITAADAGSGLASVSYVLKEQGLTEADMASQSWTDLSGVSGSSFSHSFSVDAEKQYVVYVKLVDAQGNTAYISTDGFVIDYTAPTISGVTNAQSYYTSQTLTVADNFGAIGDTELKVNGTAVTLSSGSYTIAGDPSQAVSYTLVASDAAGNVSTQLSIKMLPIDSLRPTNAQGAVISPDNVQVGDKSAIEDAIDAVEEVKQNQSGSATQAEKDKLDDILQDCNQLLDLIDSAQDVIDLIENLPDPEDVEPDNKAHVEAYEAAKKAYDDMVSGNDDLAQIIGEDNKAKLDAVGEAVINYRIIKGSGSWFVRKTDKTVGFIANGPVRLELDNGGLVYFTGISVDGKAVDRSNYTVRAGSTYVTLRTEYLETLDSGLHNIRLHYSYLGRAVSTDYGYFTVYDRHPGPVTGDSGDLMLYGGLAMTSLLCAAALLIIIRKKSRQHG